MQHEPHGLQLVQAHLNEVVAGSQRPQMICVVSTIQLWMLRQDRIIASLQLAGPDRLIARRNLMPRSAIARAAVIGPSVRYCAFDGAANTLYVLAQKARIQTRLACHHPASNVHTDRRWN